MAGATGQKSGKACCAICRGRFSPYTLTHGEDKLDLLQINTLSLEIRYGSGKVGEAVSSESQSKEQEVTRKPS